MPFGDLDFVRYVMHLRPALKMNTHGKGKYLLRKAFAQGGYLPESILWREKAAFSDAVGHSLADELKAYAESIYSDEDLARAASPLPRNRFCTATSLKNITPARAA